MTAKPLILLIFANDRAAYLESITQERQQLLDLLEPWEERFGFQVKSIDYSTADGVIEALNTHHERLVMLHFAGHSKTDILHLDTGRAHANGLAAKLGNCPNLKLVFLNGCNNASLVRAIAEAGIPSVVGTSQRIADKLAADFSQSFFNALVTQGKNVAEAFQQAKSDVETVTGKGYRSLDLQAPLEERYEWAWFMESQQPTWKLADAFHPCSRLPALKRGELPAKPFKNLYYYTKDDAEIFFGRCQAIWDVLTLLDETSEPLLLLHGGTGVGKSSFLQAGLIPRLKAPARQQIVHYKRCSEFNPQLSLLEQLFGSSDPVAISACLDANSTDKLPEIWIIDQMEEIFLSYERIQNSKATIPPVLSELMAALYCIFYPTDGRERPNAKLIFCLRKEWFAELYNACHEHGINHGDYLLNPLDKAAIIEVIEAPTEDVHLRQHYRLQICNPPDGHLAGQIADDLLTDKQSNIAPTLQIIISQLWDRVEKQPKRVWDAGLYLNEKRAGLLLEDYLDRQLQDIVERENWGKSAYESGLLLDVLYAHTTAQATAKNITALKYGTLYPHISYRVDLLKALKDRYLIIEPQMEGYGAAVKSTRLAHDTLAQLIRRRFEESALPGPQLQKIMRIKCQQYTHENPDTFLDEHEIGLTRLGIMGTRCLNDKEKQLLDESINRNIKSEIAKEVATGILFLTAVMSIVVFLKGIGVSLQ